MLEKKRPLRVTGAAFFFMRIEFGMAHIDIGYQRRGGAVEATGSGDFGQALELHRAGRLDDAEAAYLKLLAASPHHPDLLRLLGLLRFQQGRGDEAVALLGQAVETHPDFLDGRRTLALVLGKMGRWEEALVQHAEAVRLAPGDASVLNDFGCALLEAGRLDRRGGNASAGGGSRSMSIATR